MTRLLSASLKHRIEFIEIVKNNAFSKPMWEVKLQTYAEIKAINTHNFRYLEGLDFGHIITESLYIIRLRFTKIKLNNCRIKYDERQFEIKKITDFAQKSNILCVVAQEIYN